MVASQVLRRLVDLRRVAFHPAGRREVLGLAVPEVGLASVEGSPIRRHFRTARIHGHQLGPGEVGTGVHEQLLDHSLRALVVALAESMMPDATLRVDEVQRRPVVVAKAFQTPYSLSTATG